MPLGYKGKLYAEIVPRTFSVLIRKETRVNQIRLMNINVPKVPLLSKEAGGENVSILSLDLTPDENSGIIGYKAKRNAPILDFDGSSCYNRLDFWDPIFLGELQSIVLNPDDFYILRSREKVNIPPYRAAELEPYDSSFGEFRVHYAGFLDPGFGFKKNSSEGTPVVLEVRARDVPFLIENGQKMARVLYYSLRDNAEKLYGSSIGSSYQTQDIALGKQFKRL